MSIDALGTMYGVHRATAARWVQQGRDAVVKSTRELLAVNIKESSKAMSSFVRLLRTELDVRLRRHLTEEHEESDEPNKR